MLNTKMQNAKLLLLLLVIEYVILGISAQTETVVSPGSVPLGSQVEITCTFSGTLLAIEWRKTDNDEATNSNDGERLLDYISRGEVGGPGLDRGMELSLSTYSLIINKVACEDTGTYWCRTTLVGISPTEKSANLEVYSAHDVETASSYCTVCGNELGMKNGDIPDDDITASSFFDLPRSASHGRLFGDSYWFPGSSSPGRDWIQVTFDLHIVSGVITQGDGYTLAAQAWFVETFKIQYQPENGSRVYVTDDDGSQKLFTANTNGNTPVTNLFNQPIRTTVIRLLPQSWHGNVAVRMEILGCSV